MLHNTTDDQERGVVLGQTASGEHWFVVFSFNQTGYVKDDENDSHARLPSLPSRAGSARVLRRTTS
jgi:uncharacterized membrane-anchored protein